MVFGHKTLLRKTCPTSPVWEKQTENDVGTDNESCIFVFCHNNCNSTFLI
uniref:Uncharacterized protein n=1 Tax=Octopus bimaculoides TaxID=37653 RepID=A0A0L8I5J9_OCTBM